ncbi:GNAT family N-acetyltransferase [Spelaeicoccus albus]|uniref:GNAT family N-acetyltransferase n=1 Tax=Spelaeicoccus albus TaxID=1280376 RepID=UPI0015CB4DC6|nr:GNAT family N-acetyltransferase [Spelaeicoccus albus]
MGKQNSVFTIRGASLSDLPGLLEVQRRSGRSTSSRFCDAVSQAIPDPRLRFVVAESDDGLVGWAKTKYFENPEMDAPSGHYLMGVTVDPNVRRRGVALALVTTRLDWIRQRDNRAYYFTNASNEASIALHRNSDFYELARGPQFRSIPIEGGLGILFRADLRR